MSYTIPQISLFLPHHDAPPSPNLLNYCIYISTLALLRDHQITLSSTLSRQQEHPMCKGQFSVRRTFCVDLTLNLSERVTSSYIYPLAGANYLANYHAG